MSAVGPRRGHVECRTAVRSLRPRYTEHTLNYGVLLSGRRPADICIQIGVGAEAAGRRAPPAENGMSGQVTGAAVSCDVRQEGRTCPERR